MLEIKNLKYIPMYLYVHRSAFDNFQFIYYFIRYNMPKYAVAVGRKVGIYDTYDECKAQVLNFPKAKFKKFNTSQEAEEFIAKFSTGVAIPSRAETPKALPSSSSSNVALSKQLVNSVPIMKVEKVSPSDPVLHKLFQNINNMNDKLEKFMSSTSGILQNLQERLEYIENNAVIRCDVKDAADAPPAKIARLDMDSEFKKTEKGAVIVFTDGACSKNGQLGAKAGIGVWFSHNHRLNVSAPVHGPPTNNNAEIQAARTAIQQAHGAGIKRLSIHTDSKFVISCMTEWIENWKVNGWQLSTGGPVKNKVELEKLDQAIQMMESVEWVYVTAHCGVEGNEMADKLAREGAVKYKGNTRISPETDEDS